MGVVLALDPGERRTGMAISDSDCVIATPLTTHDRRRDGSLVAAVVTLCQERAVARILVGHALTAHGTAEASAQRGERLAVRLRTATGLPVELVDERYSSAAADRLLRGSGRPKQDRDALAAAFILQEWLDSQRAA
jgi:putative Holliday junction resolvase